jgi:uncharacterized membrane protein
MATAATAARERAQPRLKISLAPNWLDRLLAAAAVVLLAMVVAALWRGKGEWDRVPVFVWLHIATIGTALALTPVMLLRRRGDRLHRRLGWVWAAAMILTAAFSFGIRGINDGGFSFIHLFSVLTIVQVPVIVWTARTHRHARHRNTVRAMVAFALLTAGFFTFPFDRMLGSWLFG